jgi:hypothetical protein
MLATSLKFVLFFVANDYHTLRETWRDFARHISFVAHKYNAASQDTSYFSEQQASNEWS